MRRGLWALIGTTALLLAGCGGEGATKARPEPSPAETSVDMCGPIFDEAQTVVAYMSATGSGKKIRVLNGLADRATVECPDEAADDLAAAVEALEDADGDLNGCVLDPNCNVHEVATNFNDALEQLRRVVAG